jgi:hypothetical protein
MATRCFSFSFGLWQQTNFKSKKMILTIMKNHWRLLPHSTTKREKPHKVYNKIQDEIIME